MKQSAPDGARLPGPIRSLVVYRAASLPGDRGPRGHIRVGALVLPCALGATGLTRRKQEGDKATPVAVMQILHGYFRPDKMRRPCCRIPLATLTRTLGWCDDAGSTLYNRPASLPLKQSHETMWRRDELYDIVFVLDYNIAPRRPGRGSAIFFHCAKPGLPPTLGCVAIDPAAMRRLVPRLARNVILRVV